LGFRLWCDLVAMQDFSVKSQKWGCCENHMALDLWLELVRTMFIQDLGSGTSVYERMRFIDLERNSEWSFALLLAAMAVP
ncbi:hypothetical protein Tco_0930408, partial [Tanacetum coccineum]